MSIEQKIETVIEILLEAISKCHEDIAGLRSEVAELSDLLREAVEDGGSVANSTVSEFVSSDWESDEDSRAEDAESKMQE